MTDKEVLMQQALGTYLPLKWAERDKLYAEGNKLYAEGHKLHAEGRKLYIDAIRELYGPEAVVDWETGEVKVND